MADPYVEIIGLVKDDMTVKALTSINLGKSLGELLFSWRVELLIWQKADWK